MSQTVVNPNPEQQGHNPNNSFDPRFLAANFVAIPNDTFNQPLNKSNPNYYNQPSESRFNDELKLSGPVVEKFGNRLTELKKTPEQIAAEARLKVQEADYARKQGLLNNLKATNNIVPIDRKIADNRFTRKNISGTIEVPSNQGSSRISDATDSFAKVQTPKKTREVQDLLNAMLSESGKK